MARRAAWGGVAIAAVACAAYADSFRGPFVYDDVDAIRHNVTLASWAAALHPPLDTTAGGRPVFNLSLALSHALSGVQVWGYHAVNLLIHVGAALALYGLLRRVFARGPAWLPCAVALAWAVHPLQTESVSYLSQRAESLMGFFFLFTLYAFARGWRVASVAACFLGMGAKETMALAPIMVFLYDRTFVAGSFAGAWKARKGYYSALAASWIFLLALMAGGGGNRNGTIGFGIGVSPFAYGLTQFRAVVTYLRLSVWPSPLNFNYGTLWVHSAGEVLPMAAAVMILFAATVWALVRRPALGFWGAWFFLLLAPTSLVPGTTEMIVEHRMYLPLVAVVVIGVERVLRNALSRPLASLIILALALLTWQRNKVYASELTLWGDSAAKAPESGASRENYGVALNEANRPEEAIQEFEAAKRIDPRAAKPWDGLGDAWTKLGRPDRAQACYQQALQLDPNNTEVMISYGNLLQRIGQFAPAIAEYRSALRIKPSSAEAQCDWGLTLDASGHPDQAEPHYAEALKIDPDFAEAEFNWGNAARRGGRLDEAMAHYRRALGLRPGYPDAEMNLGTMLLQQGNLPEAIAYLEPAVRAVPSSPDALNSLGLAYAREGNLSAAVPNFEAALRLRPAYPAAQSNLAAAKAILSRQTPSAAAGR